MVQNVGCLFLAVWLGLTAVAVRGAVTSEDQASIAAMAASLKRAGKVFAAKRYDASAQTIRDVQRQLEAMLPRARADAELLEELKPLYGSLQKAHALLKEQGFAFDALPAWPTVAAPPQSSQTGTPSAVVPSGEVRFAVDLAGVLSEQCGACHGAARAQGGFSVADFKTLMDGGDSGPAIVAGMGRESLLIQKLRGTADGQRMPLNRPALSDELIAKFQSWIDHGATLDAATPTMALVDLAKVARAGSATAEELTRQREELVQQHWELAMPGVRRQQVTTEHFLLVGRMSEKRLQALGQIAERELAVITAQLRVPSNTVFKGRVTLLVFDRRYDLAEFARMVEKREVASQQHAFWKHDSVEVYSALVAADEESDAEMDLWVSEQVAALAIAEMRGTPDWFADGAARVVAARIHRSAPRVRQWDSEARDALRLVQNPNDFLAGERVSPEMRAVRYAFAKSLAAQSRSFYNLLAQIREGHEFTAAFQTAYRATPAEAASAWWGGK